MTLTKARAQIAERVAWEQRHRDDLRMFFAACSTPAAHPIFLRSSGLVIASRCVVQPATNPVTGGPEAQWRASDPDDPHGGPRNHRPGLTILDLVGAEGPRFLRVLPLEERQVIHRMMRIGDPDGKLGDYSYEDVKIPEEKVREHVATRTAGFLPSLGTRGKLAQRELELGRSLRTLRDTGSEPPVIELYVWSDSEFVVTVDGRTVQHYRITRPVHAFPRIDPYEPMSPEWDVVRDRALEDGVDLAAIFARFL